MGILDGRVAIVTGAASGVGRACAERFAYEGAAVVLADIQADLVTQVTEGIVKSGARAVAVECDVAKESDIDAVVQAAVQSFGTIDILANIAQGEISDFTPLEATGSGTATSAFVTGPLASMLFMQKCLPYMKERNYGRIINTSSHSAVNGTPNRTSYDMAKGAIMALTRVASQEWGKYGIVTNSFLPIVHSPSWEGNELGRIGMKMITERSPVGRLGSAYTDCAPLLAFLASEQAGYINGQAIGVDGGFSLIA